MYKENLIAPFGAKAWHYVTLSGRNVSFESTDTEARIAVGKESFGVGKWLCELDIEGGAVYDFSVKSRSALSERELYVLLTQLDADGKSPVREHVRHAVRKGGEIHFFEKLEAHERTVRLRVELWLKGRGEEVVWLQPSLVRGESALPRHVRVAPIHMGRVGGSWQEQYENILRAVDRAGEAHPDLIVLGERPLGRGLGLPLEALAECEESDLARALRAKARQYNAYVVYNTVEAAEGLFYNTSFLFGRDGGVIGKYRKTHLPVTEYEEGLCPGESYPVFDLDFGRVGLLICYDQFFPRTAMSLAGAGAELICISTAGDMHYCNFARAMENGVYLAVAGMNNENGYGWGATRVVDPLGNLLAATDENFAAAIADIDLEARVRRHWMSTGPALSDVRGDYRFEKNLQGLSD